MRQMKSSNTLEHISEVYFDKYWPFIAFPLSGILGFTQGKRVIVYNEYDFVSVFKRLWSGRKDQILNK